MLTTAEKNTMQNDTEISVINQDELFAVIEGFDANDYMSMDGKPYAWLFSYKNKVSDFSFSIIQEKMEQHAVSIGVKKFRTLAKKYHDSVVSKTQSVYNSPCETHFNYPGLDRELSCSSSYYADDDGVEVESPYGGTIKICSHPILPVKRLHNIVTGKHMTEIAYKRSDGRWQTATFDKTVLTNKQKITDLASNDIDVTSDTAGELVKYLRELEQMNYDVLPKELTVDHMGWVDGFGFVPYIDELAYEQNGMYEHEFKAVRSAGRKDEWLKLAKEVRASDSIPARIALAASFASVLLKKMDALPFIVHLWGSASGVGKSVALMLAASVWAYPEIGEGYVKLMNSTAVGMEQMAAFCGNLPLCLDELQLIMDKKNFDVMIYNLCSGATKVRGAKNGGLQLSRTWKNAIITTGEQPITTGYSRAGAANRVLEIECTNPLVANPREAVQTMLKNYGWAGQEFVRRLQEDSDAEIVMQDAQKAFTEELSDSSTDKQILSASILLTADYLANLYIFEDDNSLTTQDILPYLLTKNDANVNKRAYEYLIGWTAQHTNKFTPIINNDVYQGECWGCYETDREGNPHTVCIIKERFDNAMNDKNFNPDSFLSWAAKEGVITTSNGHKTKLKRVIRGGAPVRCVFLKLPDCNTELEQPKAVTDGMMQVDVGGELPW